MKISRRDLAIFLAIDLLLVTVVVTLVLLKG